MHDEFDSTHKAFNEGLEKAIDVIQRNHEGF